MSLENMLKTKNYIIPRISLLIFFLLNICIAASCLTLKVKDDSGREIKILKPPQRIVSLSPTDTEILFALGLKDKIVGVTNYCDFPLEAKKKQKIGGFSNPDIDKILALKPDLILAFGTIQMPIVKELRKKGERVFWFYPRTVKDILDSFEKIGKITGVEAAGKQLKENTAQKIKYIQARIGNIPESKRLSIFRVMGLNPLGTVGKNSFQTSIFYLAGGKNIFADIKKDFFQVSLKTLIKRDPDIIVICGKDTNKIKQKVESQKGWSNLRAVKDNRIFVIPCDLICRPGPRVADTIKKIADYLYPEKFSDYPQRIISLGPFLTEELYLLDAEDKLVGCTIYAPAYAKNKEKVGTVTDISLERIIGLKPDLILATSLANPDEIDKLKKLGIKVVIFPQLKSFQDLCNQFLELANLIGKGKRAKGIVKEAKEKVEFIKSKTKNLKKTKVFIQIGAKPLFTAASKSLINNFIELAGGTNIASNAKTGLYSREKVVKENPDVLIIVTMGIAGRGEKKMWEKYKVINAVKNNRIYIFDSYKLCSPTPANFADTLKDITKILHPELRKSAPARQEMRRI